MANLKASIRGIRVAARNRVRNLKYMSQIKKLIKSFKAAPTAEGLRKAVSILDKAALKGILHRNNAARKKSQLMKLLFRSK